LSRSKRKTPITGISTAESEKKDKRKANRIFRRMAKQAINQEAEIIPVKMEEASEVYKFNKDGKQWHGNKYPKLLRK